MDEAGSKITTDTFERYCTAVDMIKQQTEMVLADQQDERRRTSEDVNTGNG